MSSEELTHWMQFYRLEPFGPERDNIHAGIVASTLVNIYQGYTGKKTKDWTAQDFLVIDKKTRDKQTTAQFAGALKALAKPKKADNGK